MLDYRDAKWGMQIIGTHSVKVQRVRCKVWGVKCGGAVLGAKYGAQRAGRKVWRRKV